MATGANIAELHSISAARTGRIRVSRLVLTGWASAVPSASAGFKSWSDDGRLWGVYTSSTADFSLYRRSTAGSGDKVCSGTVSAGKVTLSQANSSGHSGSADVDNGTPGTNPDSDATFDVVVCYADENDLLRIDRQADKYLASGLYPGGASGTRFESLLSESKRMLDRWLVERLGTGLLADEWGRPLLANLVRTGDFARCHALLALHVAALGRGVLGADAVQMAQAYMDLARQEFKGLTLQLDAGRDTVADAYQFGWVSRLIRG